LPICQKICDKYFKVDGDVYAINQEVKNCVEFSKHNLLADPYPKTATLSYAEMYLFILPRSKGGNL